MYTDTYISHLLLLTVQPHNVTRIFQKNFINTTFIFVFTHVDNIFIHIILKGSKSANHIIFLNYLSGMKIL